MKFWVLKNEGVKNPERSRQRVFPKTAFSDSVPEAGFTGLGGGFMDESGIGSVLVPSGYAGFTRASCRAGTGGGAGELDFGEDWMYGPTAATLEPPPC